MFKNIGTAEIIIVAVVLLIIFGPKKLPDLAKGIAQAVKEIKGIFEEKEKDTEKKDENKEKS